MRVLIIDDERSIRTSTAVAIQAAGHSAETADSGQIAVLKLQEDAYDLAFLDLRLGDEDGLEILEQIKRQHPKLPVVVFTAYASVASAVAAMQRGATDYLEKPFTPEHLRQILARVEKQRKLESKIDDLQQQINLLDRSENGSHAGCSIPCCTDAGGNTASRGKRHRQKRSGPRGTSKEQLQRWAFRYDQLSKLVA
jgi:DNA-binding NtrC family response regulator